MSEAHRPTLWVDVDDLLDYLAHHSRPSGIQRVTFEICRALYELDQGSGCVRFVRRGDHPGDLTTIGWEQLRAAFARASHQDGTPAGTKAVLAAMPVSALAPGAASDAKAILRRTLALQGRAFLALVRLPLFAAAAAANALTRWIAQRRTRSVRAESAEAISLEDACAPGDCLLVLGSPWMRQDYAQTVRWVRDERRMRFAMLVYDLVPLRRPEWCDRFLTGSFVAWHKSVLPLADQVFAISRATASDVEAWAKELGIALPTTVQALPMGTGLEQPGNLAAAEPAASSADRLPASGSYVLFVSTIEARKNHALLFRVWRRLMTELPPEQVPILVFAGRVGWMVSDLMQQLENAHWLGGKIQLVHAPTDVELAALYRGCRFTLFPSLFEGWGLPVSESLALGKACIASNRTSLPEAGGDLARYFDPENLEDAFETIRAVIQDPEGLESWNARIARDFRHVPWQASATLIRERLDGLDELLR